MENLNPESLTKQLEETKDQIKGLKKNIRNKSKRVKPDTTTPDLDIMADPTEAKKYYAALKEKELAEKETTNNKLLNLKLAKTRKELIDIKAVHSIISEVFTKLKTILYASTNTIPAQIEGKNHAEISSIIYQFIDGSLEQFYKEYELRINTLKIDEDIEEDNQEEGVEDD